MLSCIFYITKTIPIHAYNSYDHELILILYTWCFSLLKGLKTTALPQTLKLHVMHNLPILFLYLVFLDEQNCTITKTLISSIPCVGMYKTMFIWYIIVARLLKARTKVLLGKKKNSNHLHCQSMVWQWMYCLQQWRQYVCLQDGDTQIITIISTSINLTQFLQICFSI